MAIFVNCQNNVSIFDEWHAMYIDTEKDRKFNQSHLLNTKTLLKDYVKHAKN